MSFWRNAEVRRDGFLHIGMGAILLAVGFSQSETCGWLMLLSCVLFSGAHFGITFWRYRHLRRLAGELDALLHGGTPLPLNAYQEGELSVLYSQIRKMTQRLQETAEALEKDKHFLSDSLADISHQLRTPITGIRLILSMLSAADVTPQRRMELTRELRTAVSRMEWLVEALLKMSQLDAGAVRFHPVEIEAARVIEMASQPLQVAMELRGQNLLVEGGQARLVCDPVWTGEALGNILKNCMEFTPEGGKIRIQISQNSLYTMFRIQDSGSGIDPKDLPHIFERFYKSKHASGIGIGLSLSRQIITAQEGTVQAENGDPGAVFTVRFYKQII